jgi:hypothetical protein
MADEWDGDPIPKHNMGHKKFVAFMCPDCDAPMACALLIENKRPIGICGVCGCYSYISDIIGAGLSGLEEKGN